MISGTTFYVLWWIFVFLVGGNFIPTAIAYAQAHPRRGKLAALNVISLFSFALWVVLMAWAVGGGADDSRVTRFLANRQNRRMLGASIVAMFVLSFGSTLYTMNLI